MPPSLENTAFLFPGQGSQRVGMGRELAQAEPLAAEVFAQADAILGIPLSRLCWQGPQEDLNDTINTQPALLTHSIAVLRVLQARLPDLQPTFVAGHSLGQFSALVAAGSLTFPEALRLVRARGEAMKAAGEERPGGMLAVLGLEAAVVESACRQAAEDTGAVVTLANDNCPGQAVISGQDAGLERAMELLRQAGARRLVRLAVSIAAHSPLMEPAKRRFDRALALAQFHDPEVPVVGNVSAAPLRSAPAVRADAAAQLTSRVRWTESMQLMLSSAVDTFLELGPGNVLCGLLRRLDRKAACLPLDTPESFEPLLG